MSVLVFAEASEGKVKKSSLESVAYAVAANLGKVDVLICTNGPVDGLESLAEFGADKVWVAENTAFDGSNMLAHTTALVEAAKSLGSKLIVTNRSSLTDALAPRVAARLQAGIVTNVVSLPSSGADFSVSKSVYTGKAFVSVALKTDVKVLTIRKNVVELKAVNKPFVKESLSVSLSQDDSRIQNLGTEKATGEVLLPEAEIVVSAGRGLKGPENWGIIEKLAHTIGAATACSKPVSDMNWRPHHEHVGQTGIKVSPNLYFAIGISGAIQHVAGISSSKVIVAINSDPEAPIFKAADYGIVGDAFKIVPALTEAFEKAL